MPFGVMSRVDRGMDVLDGGGYHQRGRGSFMGKCGVSHCNQSNMGVLVNMPVVNTCTATDFSSVQ